MKPNLLKLLTFLFVFFGNLANAQVIWEESFSVSEKGVWGDENGSTIHKNFEGVTKWTLDFSNISVARADDYAKTVSTGGGRFECRDINGEAIWRSIEIDISAYNKVYIQLSASETGSGANEQTKYLKAFYKLNEGEEILFETNGENHGNWGSNLAEQKDLAGQKLQIVVYINNHYSADKVILDEIIVLAEEKPLEPIYPGEVLISEVLFNPFSDGNDYVEIYNNSDKQIPVNQLYLASRDNNLELTQIYSLFGERFVFQPESYLALTKDTNGVFPFFTIECSDCFLQMGKFPSFNNDADYVVLLNSELQVIDEFFYTDKLHAPLLADEEGISLERISFTTETNNINNWHSASTQSGYGTPGYQNSQFKNENTTELLVTFEPESFSPNSDGYNDEYKIRYQLDKAGYLANITIFDTAGRFVMQLAKNDILGTSGTFSWNGENETGQRQNLGVYVVVVEVFDLQGNIHRYKDGVVLTDILE
ncbi:MAG: lamin tail domain-containing protein [Bacteroidetes bacterium]|nr:lamin tail domain-containing protein [Bacteroidota bacterium]